MVDTTLLQNAERSTQNERQLKGGSQFCFFFFSSVSFSSRAKTEEGGEALPEARRDRVDTLDDEADKEENDDPGRKKKN